MDSLDPFGENFNIKLKGIFKKIPIYELSMNLSLIISQNGQTILRTNQDFKA